MKFFLDTANVEEIKQANDLGLLDGVTTNPTLMAREGKKFKDTVLEICEVCDGPVSAEVVALDFENIMKEAHEVASWAPNIVVKIPMLPDGIKAVKALSDEGIPTNVTLVFSPNQAILAAKAGATFVSPFLGRLDDIGHDGVDLIEQIASIFDAYDFATEVLAASLRSASHVWACAEAGADIVTMPIKVLMALFNHPLTDKGIKAFLDDWKKGGFDPIV